MITIIDYGVGNIKSFVNIYKKLSIDIKIAKEAKDLVGSTKLILPGVGHFDYAMKRFADSGMMSLTNQMVLTEKIPVLGICVGMQMLAQKSEEGVLSGLGWIKGEVKKIDTTLLKHSTALPHMGWNNIKPIINNPLLLNLDINSRFYFLHSYYFKSYNIEDTIALSIYGKEFSSAINYKNIYGVQFHPEKSHQFGIILLENFANV